jgi:heme a synthase
MANPSSVAKTSAKFSQATFVVAILTACAILPLILVGAGVTTTDAGMAYPDWPTSDGHLLNPPGWTESSPTLFEHGHRLIGWVVGMLAIALAILCWKRRGLCRGVGLGTLLAIVVQGTLGGFRVTEISTTFAMIHGMWGQVCFCLACTAALVTSRSWINGAGRIQARSLRFFRRGCVLALVSVVIQLGLGATYRHFDSGHALIGHVLWAVWLVLILGWAAFWMLGEYPRDAILGKLGRALGVLLITQLLLGGGAFIVVVMGGAWSPFLMWAVPSAHVLVGAAILACMVMTTFSSYHLLCEAPEHQDAGVATSSTATAS